MKAESVIAYRLGTFAGVTAIVGTGTANDPTRIYPVAIPQTRKMPLITYRVVSSDRIESVYSDPGMASVRFQITCWAQTYDDVKELAEQVRLALERYGSAVSGTQINGVTVYDIHMGSEVDLYEPTLEAFGVATDYIVQHAE